MPKKDAPVIAIILGDHAGIGPEVVAKALAAKTGDWVPALVGNRALFEKCLDETHLELPLAEGPAFSDPGSVHFVDVPAGRDIVAGQVSADSGRLILDSMDKAVAMGRAGEADALVLAPITKQSLHLSGAPFTSEFELFADRFGVASVKSVVKCDDIYRSTVVGHCPFVDIAKRLDVEGIVQTARELLAVMRLCGAGNQRLAVAALNPHAGEDGLFGDEEARIIQPAIDILRADGADVVGPCPADTVLLKARAGHVGGIVYLYHDQGNIAMKSSFFGSAVLIYTNVPLPVVSVGHGSALDIAGQSRADAQNMTICLETLERIFTR